MTNDSLRIQSKVLGHFKDTNRQMFSPTVYMKNSEMKTTDLPSVPLLSERYSAASDLSRHWITSWNGNGSSVGAEGRGSKVATQKPRHGFAA